MFGLDPSLTVLLVICILCACAFEFINGFHDTANAVATVIYTNTLKPFQAVLLSGIANAAGVFIGGISVAVGIINLLPVETLIDQNIAHSMAMVFALLATAIFWNLGTWYLGIPCSSSHTLIGSILGVGIAYSLLPDAKGAAVNWGKAYDIGLSLLLSPALGLSLTVLIMFLMRILIKNPSIFSAPPKNKKPPIWIRTILLLTCTSVSMSHGSNDGQKGVGLMMLILIGIVPAYFAIDLNQDHRDMKPHLVQIEQVLDNVDTLSFSEKNRKVYHEVQNEIFALNAIIAGTPEGQEISEDQRFETRKSILLINKSVKDWGKSDEEYFSEEQIEKMKAGTKGLSKHTDYAPFWVIILISLSLGIGTMIGWKRIVVTIGEKIGKTHLTYAQGASAEIVAASTIGFSTFLGLPVSTTHVLSSGIAGSMIASDGLKNLQRGTIKNILIAWLLTFPVCVTVSGSLFLLLRNIL